MADSRSRSGATGQSIDNRGKDIVEKIFNSRDILLDQQVLSKIRDGVSDDKIADAIYDFYKKRLSILKRKAEKFKTALNNKYNIYNLSLDKILDIAKKYIKKYDFTDGEFNMFINLLVSDKALNTSVYNIPNNPMSKTLGFTSYGVFGDKLHIAEGELQYFQEIMKIDQATKQMHNHLKFQTIKYGDCSLEALTGKYHREKDNAFTHIHPVLAALFIPKLEVFENRMLECSISELIRRKNENLPLDTEPLFELYWDLINDPNQGVCAFDSKKVMEDLRNRVLLQVELWKNVLNLRMGRYYSPDVAGFYSAIAQCKNSLFEAPDLSFTADETAILRRLMNAFSLRPTVVQIQPYIAHENLKFARSSMSSVGIQPSYPQITTVPMINVRLPTQEFETSTDHFEKINIFDGLQQPQWFLDGKDVRIRTQKLNFTRGVLIFHVDRRYKSVGLMTARPPFLMAGLPKSMSILDSVNMTSVDCPAARAIDNVNYALRSSVFLEVTAIRNDKSTGGDAPERCVVTGCSAGIVNLSADDKSTYLYYDPAGACFYKNDIEVSPVTTLQYEPSTPGSKNFSEYLEKFGSIYIYGKV